MINNERRNPFEKPEFDFEDSEEASQLTPEQQAIENAETRESLVVFAGVLGLIETPEMEAIRVDISAAPTVSAVEEKVTDYREAAEQMHNGQGVIQGAKQQIGVYLMIASMYVEREMWDEADDMIETADAYAYEMSQQFGDQFAPILERLATL